jgi:hypothetical protein
MAISLLVQQPLAPNAVSLGRLVFNISAPWQDFCPFSPIELNALNDISATPFLHVRDIIERTHDTKFNATLTQAMLSAVGRKNKSIAGVTAPHGAAYRLMNSGNYFERVCQDGKVRAWFERAIKRNFDVYMVVGIITLTDVEVIKNVDASSHIDGNVEVPIAAFLTSGISSIVPGGKLLDSGIGGGRSTHIVKKTSYLAPGDRIIAVQYRKVRYEWFNRHSVDTAFLEKGNRWIVQTASDRSELTNVGEEVVDAHLAETSCLDDLDVEYEVFTIRTGEEFILVEQVIPKEFVAQ